MFGENRLIENLNKLGEQMENGVITQDQANYDFGRAIGQYGDYNAIMGSLVGTGLFIVSYIALDNLIKPVSKKLITKFRNKKNSKLKVEEKERA